jgi:hypothetical protein
LPYEGKRNFSVDDVAVMTFITLSRGSDLLLVVNCMELGRIKKKSKLTIAVL